MKKRIAFDMGLNIIATAIPIVVLQLIIFPLVSKIIPSNSYGFLLTILSLMNMCPGTIASVINNIRLLRNSEYEKKNLFGDFNGILYASIIVNVIIVCGSVILLNNEIIVTDAILIIIVSILWILQNYYIVEFRIKINYKAILVNNIFMGIGYIVGYAVFLVTLRWIWIYVIGQLLGLLHILLTSKLKFWKEPLKITKLFRSTLIDYGEYMIATFLGRCTTFADRLLLFPIMGGTVVSIYYAATVFGKVVTMAISPITGVVLSYLATEKGKPKKVFNQMLVIVSILGGCGYVFAIIISKPVLTILYPQFVDEAMNYIFITTATLVLSVISSIINPFILRFFAMKYQIYINAVSMIIYVALSLILLIKWGLMGFCIGALIANIVKTIFMLAIFYRKNQVKSERKERNE